MKDRSFRSISCAPRKFVSFPYGNTPLMVGGWEDERSVRSWGRTRATELLMLSALPVVPVILQTRP